MDFTEYLMFEIYCIIGAAFAAGAVFFGILWALVHFL